MHLKIDYQIEGVCVVTVEDTVISFSPRATDLLVRSVVEVIQKTLDELVKKNVISERKADDPCYT